MFTGLAFAIIIYTATLQYQSLRTQQKELKAQQEELKLTRQELKTHSNQFKKQTEIFDKQIFEATFFQMLQLYNEIIKSSVLSVGNRELKGREAIAHINDNLDSYYSKISKGDLNKLKQKDYISKNYEVFNTHRLYGISNYYRVVYQIIIFVEKSSIINIINKKLYINLLKAQLSNEETRLLFYNYFTSNENHKLELSNKYHLFEYLSKNKLLHPEHITYITQ